MQTVKMAVLVILALLCSCGYISDIGSPSTVQPNSIFPIVLETTITAQGGGTGGCSIMLPTGWSVDGVFYNGSSSGTMEPDPGLAENLLFEFPPPVDFKWLSFRTTESCMVDTGDVFNVHMTVHNDNLEGTVYLAYHVAWFDMYWAWENDPVPDSLVVEELALNQNSWASIKGEFQNIRGFHSR